MGKYAKAARLGADRTVYTSRRKLSFREHHEQRMFLSVVKSEADKRVVCC